MAEPFALLADAREMTKAARKVGAVSTAKIISRLRRTVEATLKLHEQVTALGQTGCGHCNVVGICETRRVLEKLL